MKIAAKLLLSVVLISVPAAFALAEQQTQRVVGTIAAVDDNTLAVKTRDREVKVDLTGNVAVFGVVKATLADLRPGAFVGVGATPQPDGSRKAIRVTIFSESQRGTGEGHRPWTEPGST